jgi:hypothetical protein
MTLSEERDYFRGEVQYGPATRRSPHTPLSALITGTQQRVREGGTHDRSRTLVLLLVVVAIAYVATHAPRQRPHDDVDSLLERWTSAGLLSGDSAAAIARYEHRHRAPAVAEHPRQVAPAPAPSPVGRRAAARIPVVAEALGYLGGVLAVLGLVLIVSRYWPDMSPVARLALSGGGSLALLVAGLEVRTGGERAFERLQGSVWVASVACAALFSGVLAADAFDAEAPKIISAFASAAVVVESALLWRGRGNSFPQLTLFGGLVVFVGSGVASVAGGGAAGLAVWLVGAVLVIVGVQRLAPTPAIGEVVGAAAMAVGAFMTVAAWDEPALLFAAATGGVLLAAAVVPGLAPDRGDHLRLGMIGAVVSLQAVPGAVGYFAQDAGLATGLVTWGIALGLLYLGIRKIVRIPGAVVAIGAIGALAGAAVTAAQAEGFATIFGVLTAVGLVALGMLPEQTLLSLVGSAGLLINVLWGIDHFFPGEGRAPLLILVAGGLILAIAVLLARAGDVRRSLAERRRARLPG